MVRAQRLQAAPRDALEVPLHRYAPLPPGHGLVLLLLLYSCPSLHAATGNWTMSIGDGLLA